jgi:hypothetical protein
MRAPGLLLTTATAFLACIFGFNGSPGRARAAGGDYVYVEDLDRIVGVSRGSWMICGKFDAEGELIPDSKHHPALRNSNLPHYASVNLIVGEPQPCFELRSGRLVKGTMVAGGHFVPDLGSQVTKFEDYRFGEGGPRIWNLPGTFMRSDKLEERRKWLAEHMAESPEAFGKEKARLDAAIKKK